MRRRAGYIREVGEGTFVIEVKCGTTIDGKPRRQSRTIHNATREDAELEAAKMRMKLAKTGALDDATTLYEYYWYRFREAPSVRGTQRAPSTLSWYDHQMRQSVLPWLGDRPVSRITHADVVDVIEASGSPSNTKRTLRAVLTAAYADGLLYEKPFQRRIITPRRKMPKVEPWSPFEVSEALVKFRNLRPELEAWLILGLSGLRKSEALGVRPCDIEERELIDFQTGETYKTMLVHVRHTYSELNGERDATKNEASERTVPVFMAGRDRLRAIIEGRDPNQRITKYMERHLNRLWREGLRELGLRYIPPKALRATSDTLALNAGVGADLNDKMHGRTEHATTYRHYYAPDALAMEQAARALQERGGGFGASGS